MERLNIYEEELEKLINDRGNNADWEQAIVCNCVSRDSGQPDFRCPTCGGSGYRYLSPKRIVVGVTSISGNKLTDSLGLREPGMAYITPTADVIMGFRDRVRFPDFKCIFSENVLWGQDKISPKLYREIKGIEFLADDEYEYELGADFIITEDGFHLKWVNDKTFNRVKGKNLSCRYLTTPSYLVSDLLHELRATLSDRKQPKATFRELPKQYQIKREDFMYNVKEDGSKPETSITDEVVI